MKCDKCGGEGTIYKHNIYMNKPCDKCFGKKELDWVENIVGVDLPMITAEQVKISSSYLNALRKANEV
jgi:DnaJ-class molecular chaperone